MGDTRGIESNHKQQRRLKKKRKDEYLVGKKGEIEHNSSFKTEKGRHDRL